MPNVASYLRIDADLSGDPLNPTPSWTDYTQHFVSCKSSRGLSGVFDLYKVGTLQLVARNGRKGTDAPWLDPEVWYRWRQIRVVYIGGGVDQPLFTGYITKTEHSLNQPLNVNIVTISAVDKLGVIQQEALDIVGTATDDPENIWADNGLRLTSIDQFIDVWSENFFSDTIDVYGGSSCPIHFVATEDDVPGQPANTRRRARRRTVSGNFWQLLQDGLEAEYGSFHIDATGGFAFNGRYAPLRALADGLILSLTDTPTTGTDHQIKQGTLEFAPPGSAYYDAAVATGTTKNQQKTSVSPGGYPETVYQRSSLPCPNDNWVYENTVLWSTLFSQTASWPSKATIVLDPRRVGTTVALATATLGRYAATVAHTPAGSTQITHTVLIEGIDHTIVADPPVWEATLSMTNLDRWLSAYGTFDDYGVLGSVEEPWTLGTSRLAP